ncbi:hypothetical protein AAVH_22740 [Aphelenchoides avenae]|nr:hypothetical protein AAVH_22740 [Aphelenchus avenae]
MFELENLCFLELPPLSKNFGPPTSYFLTFAQNWLVVLMTSLHAIIIFTFNSKVRIALKELLGRGQKTKAVWASSNNTSRI